MKGIMVRAHSKPDATFVDAMERVYPDRWPSPDPAAARLHAAAGGCAAVVVAARAARQGVISIKFEGYADQKAWPAPRLFTLRAVPVLGNMGKPGAFQTKVSRKYWPHLVRRAPFRVHEVMLPGEKVETDGHTVEAFLALFELPRHAQPGGCAFRLTLTMPDDVRSLSGSLTVHPAAWPKRQRLSVTNWISLARLLYPYPGVKLWSERHWTMIERLLVWLRAGGQNTILLPYAEPSAFASHSGNLVDVRKDRSGAYRFGFDRFDRFVRLALRLGFERLEGGHLAFKKIMKPGDQGEWTSNLNEKDLYMAIPLPGGKGIMPQQRAEGQAAREYLRAFLMAMRKHLARRGWKDRYMQHVADEPFWAVTESYVRTCEFVRSVWPDVTLIDAASGHAAALALDIPVPELDGLDPNINFYRELIRRGKSPWFYVCCWPACPWLNRFLDFHLNKGGLLPWLAFRYGLTGFLHWGANQWPKDKDAFEAVGSGDGVILYPGPDGPVPSLRWLALRLGIEDHELLAGLAARGPAGRAKANRFCARLVTSGTVYRCGTREVRNVRRLLRQAAGQ